MIHPLLLAVAALRRHSRQLFSERHSESNGSIPRPSAADPETIQPPMGGRANQVPLMIRTFKCLEFLIYNCRHMQTIAAGCIFSFMIPALLLVLNTGFAETGDNSVPQEPPKPKAVLNAYDAREFGVVGDGATLNTTAIQNAIDAVGKGGGGRLTFPAPGRYLTGTIFLKDNVTLEISEGATLLGSKQFGDYSVDVGHCPYIGEEIDLVLIYARKAKNIGLTGHGTINGNSDNSKGLLAPDGRKQRPMMVRFEDCSEVRVDQLTFINCFSWCSHFARCNDIHVDGLNIFNHRQDGIDLESCKGVVISNCNIKAGDDAIAILSNRQIPCRNVTITNCILQSVFAGVRLGPLSQGDIANITVTNCMISHCSGGGIKIAMLEGGEIRNCLFTNLSMDSVVAPIVVMLVGDYAQTDNPQHPKIPLGKISHLSFSHIIGTASGGLNKRPDHQSVMFLHGHPRQNLEAISLSDIDLVMTGGGTAQHAADREMVDADSPQITGRGGWPEHREWGVSPSAGVYARHVRGLSLDRIRLSTAAPDLRPPVLLRDSSDISISGFGITNPDTAVPSRITLRDCQEAIITGCQDHRGGAAFLGLEGTKNDHISLQDNSLSGFASEICREK